MVFKIFRATWCPVC